MNPWGSERKRRCHVSKYYTVSAKDVDCKKTLADATFDYQPSVSGNWMGLVTGYILKVKGLINRIYGTGKVQRFDYLLVGCTHGETNQTCHQSKSHNDN
jgi:hypothetical protein